MLLLDEDSIEIQDENLASTDPLNFTDTRPYKARLEKSKSSTGLKDAIRNATGTMNGRRRDRELHGIFIYRRQHGCGCG